MRYLVLAADYDGTLARDGRVDEETLAALKRARESGRKLLLITGRELDELRQVFSDLDLFERVIAENGALLYSPAERRETLLAEPPLEQFLSALRDRKVTPLSVGRVVVATRQPNESIVVDTIRDLGLELQVIFNKGAVMVLPSGINKATGLRAGLSALGLSRHNVVGVGDAENDHAFLSLCECSVAVANALPMVKERADFVTQRSHGAGVIDLIDRLITSDLNDFELPTKRNAIQLGTSDNNDKVCLSPYGTNVLLVGPSGGGKTSTALRVLESLVESEYQFCVIDPEGDYSMVESAIKLGSSDQTPSLDGILEVLQKPDQNVIVNLVGIELEQRPRFFQSFLPRLQEMRVQTGHPHWIIVDEAHHLMPVSWHPTSLMLPQTLTGMLFITVDPEHVSQAALSTVDLVVGVGDFQQKTLQAFSKALNVPQPAVDKEEYLEAGEALAWWRRRHTRPLRFRPSLPVTVRRRHLRKYSQGELAPEQSFYFRGPQRKLNLRAQNLMMFIQLADGVDDVTWLHHLRQGDYSRWFQEVIKDDELATETTRIAARNLSAKSSRDQVKAAIQQRYTAPG